MIGKAMDTVNKTNTASNGIGCNINLMSFFATPIAYNTIAACLSSVLAWKYPFWY